MRLWRRVVELHAHAVPRKRAATGRAGAARAATAAPAIDSAPNRPGAIIQ